MGHALERSGGGASPTDDTVRGIVFLCAGVFVFSFQDIIIKLLSSTYPVHQIVFIRGFLALPILLVIVHFDSGLETLRTKKAGLHVIRSLILFLSYLSYYMAVAAVPLSVAVSLFFTAPLIITALSVLVLKERVGWRRWLGVGVGFAGVLVIVRPGLGAIEPAAFLALVCAFCYALAQLIARRLGATDSASVMSFYSMVTFCYAGAALGLGFTWWGPGEGATPASDFLLRGWVMPGGLEIAMLATVGVISAMGFYFMTQAYRLGEANQVAPFEYTSMIWAMVLGFVFLGTIPGLYTFLGAALIAGAGVYVLRRESVRRKKPLAGRGVLRGR